MNGGAIGRGLMRALGAKLVNGLRYAGGMALLIGETARWAGFIPPFYSTRSR